MGVKARSPLQITLSTWRALFLREAVNRISTERAAWVWVLLEPLAYVIFMLVLYSTVRVKKIGGIDTIIWLMVGMLTYFMFRRIASQTMNAINANRALFAYRQVKPIDAVLVRGGVEGFLMILSSIILLAGVSLFGHDIVPADPLEALEAFFGMWLLGLGFGLVCSVIIELVPEAGKILHFIMLPMTMLSGVILPIGSAPPPYRDWLLLNPAVHGVEASRLAFAPYYHAIPELDVAYVYKVALVLIFLGLALQARFADKMVME